MSLLGLGIRDFLEIKKDGGLRLRSVLTAASYLRGGN